MQPLQHAAGLGERGDRGPRGAGQVDDRSSRCVVASTTSVEARSATVMTWPWVRTLARGSAAATARPEASVVVTKWSRRTAFEEYADAATRTNSACESFHAASGVNGRQ